MSQPTDHSFLSDGTTCHAWHLAGSDDLAGPRGRPVVVMAHGLGGTADSGLEPFARGLAAAGMDVVAFDYRGFGRSGGGPRQTVSVAGQVSDYRSAAGFARRLPGVDPSRLGLWGVSLSGGHVMTVAADDPGVAAVVSLTPLVDGRAAGLLALRQHGAMSLLGNAATGVRARLGGQANMPLVARPGEYGALSLDGMYEAYTSLAGPSWRNEVDASVGAAMVRHRPTKHAAAVRCPILVQIADFDRSAPPHSAAKAAFKARAEVRHYPGDHFDVWPGAALFDDVLAHQVRFLQRALAAPTD